MKFIVLSHARCGTSYIAKLFQAFGLDVQHEAAGADGGAAWEWAARCENYMWARTARPDYADDELTLVHLVRNPYRALNSVFSTEPRVNSEIMERFVPRLKGWGSHDQRAMQFFCWHKLIRAQSPDWTIQVEGARSVLTELLGRETVKPPPGGGNSRPYKKLSDDEIRSLLRPEVLQLLDEYCDLYGYQRAALRETA